MKAKASAKKTRAASLGIRKGRIAAGSLPAQATVSPGQSRTNSRVKASISGRCTSRETSSGSTEISASARIWAKAQSPSRLMETAAAVSL